VILDPSGTASNRYSGAETSATGVAAFFAARDSPGIEKTVMIRAVKKRNFIFLTYSSLLTVTESMHHGTKQLPPENCTLYFEFINATGGPHSDLGSPTTKHENPSGLPGISYNGHVLSDTTNIGS